MFLFAKRLRFFSALLIALISLNDGMTVFAEKEATNTQTHADIYYCPMHPQVTSDKPGNCPICFMRLVKRDSHPLTGEMVEGRTAVTISGSARKTLNIQTEAVQKKPLLKTISAWGKLAHDPELYEAQVEFLQAARSYQEKERSRAVIAQKRSLTPREKSEIKLNHMGLGFDWMEALEKEGVPDRRLLFHHEGGGAWAYIEVPERDASLVQKGDKVTIRSESFPGIDLIGHIEYVDTLLNEETRTIRTRVLVDEVPAKAKPGTLVEASIQVSLGDSLVVPEAAPLLTGEKAIVFVEKEDMFHPREVMLGRKVGGYYEVKEGLMEGEKVAVNGNFFIDSESRLQSALSNSPHGGHS